MTLWQWTWWGRAGAKRGYVSHNEDIQAHLTQLGSKHMDDQSPENWAESGRVHGLSDGPIDIIASTQLTWEQFTGLGHWSEFYTVCLWKMTVKQWQLHHQEKHLNAPNLIYFEVPQTIYSFLCWFHKYLLSKYFMGAIDPLTMTAFLDVGLWANPCLYKPFMSLISAYQQHLVSQSHALPWM